MTHPDAVPLDQYGEPDWSMPRKAAEDTLAHPSIRGQDEADGRALRELREALPKRVYEDDEGWDVVVRLNADVGAFVEVWNGLGWKNDPEVDVDAKTVAEAANECRRALGDETG